MFEELIVHKAGKKRSGDRGDRCRDLPKLRGRDRLRLYLDPLPDSVLCFTENISIKNIALESR